MEQITQSLALDLVEIQHNVVNARHNDRLTRDLYITVTDKGSAYDKLPETAFAYVRGRRTDGKPVFYNAEITDRQKGLLHVNLHNYVLCRPGRCKLDIGIYNRVQDENEIQNSRKTPNQEDEIASTDSFILYIPEEVFDEVDVVESDEGSTLAQLINSARDEIGEMNLLEELVTDHETQREAKEAIREANENTRKVQEDKRQEDTNSAIENTNAAAQSARTSATVANSAAESANSAATNANSKAADLQNKLDSHYFALMEDLQSHNSSGSSHDDIRSLVSGLTTRLNALADSDDTTLDQLSEIVAYIKNNKSLIDNVTTGKVNVADIVDTLTSTSVNKPLSAKQGKVLKDLMDALTTVVGNKVDKVTGKGLSTNDYTTTEKTKLSGIASGAEVNVQSDWNVTDSNSDAFIKNKPTITSLLDSLAAGTAAPVDTDTYLASGAGSSSGNYCRRPLSYLWEYMKSKWGTEWSNYFDWQYMKMRGTLDPSINIDDLSVPGMYWCNNNPGTKPLTNPYFFFINLNPAGDCRYQIYIPYVNNIVMGDVYERVRVNNVFTPWKIRSSSADNVLKIHEISNVTELDNSTLQSGYYHVEDKVINGISTEASQKYYNILNLGKYSSYGRSQIAFPYLFANADTNAYIRTTNEAGSRPWRRLLHSGHLGFSSNESNKNYAVKADSSNNLYVNVTRTAKADQLTTSRTLFGKSFDGTGNVSGQALVFGTAQDNAASRFTNYALQIRENNQNGNASTNIKYAPGIGFHWANVIASSLVMDNNGIFHFFAQDGVNYRGIKCANINGYTIGKSVPSDAKFTDTNTWRGIQNNLTSDSTTDSLSAAQGKALKGLVDGKAASSHTHSYLPLSGGTVNGDVTTKNIKTGDISYDGSLKNSTCDTSGYYANSLGYKCKSTGNYSFSSGYQCEAGANESVAMGWEAKAPSNYGQAIGYGCTASYFQMAIGSFNTLYSGPSSAGNKSGTAFVIGNGTNTTNRSNAFRVTGAGAAYACSAFNSSGADYAEFFEWEDGNTENEDRRGYFVTLSGDKIKLAKPGDYILGVVSANPTVIGNSDEGWTGRYITDQFGSYIEEAYEYDEVSVDENGKETTTRKTGITWKENPDYDPEMTYIQRADRAEWDAVGMMGVLPVRDDGSCEVNGYCTVAEGGIATVCSRSASADVYRVIGRSGDNVVRIVIK